jgi:aryl-alcohol dehydrogenase-like predicted oxidoreductase
MGRLANKLVLGTAQLGLKYGISNKSGKPSKAESFKILDFAYKNGISIFDTAHAYGDAENILGEFLQKKGIRKEIKIITKCENPLKDPEESFKRLKTDYIDALLFHNPDCIKNKLLIDRMVDLKRTGRVKHIGVSVYDVKDAIFAAKFDSIDYIQIPYNIFDQRLDKTDFFKLTKKNKKKVFGRSVFLQGLLFMADKEIPLSIKKAKVYLSRLDKIIAKHNLSRRQIALQFLLKNKNIDYVVLGVDNITQIKENIDIVNQNIDCDKCIKEIRNKFANIEKKIISPNLWKK